MCVGVVGVVLELRGSPDEPTARVQVGETLRTVSLLSPSDVAVGDSVLLHSGFVVEVVSEEDATWLNQNRAR